MSYIVVADVFGRIHDRRMRDRNIPISSAPAPSCALRAAI
jgi:hypothetical protein